jgi:hypothetical protein
VTGDENEICLTEVGEPIEHQFPESRYAVGNEAFTFQSDCLDVARGLGLVSLYPIADCSRSVVGEANRSSCGLTEDLLYQWSRKVTMYTDSDGILDLGWGRSDRDMLRGSRSINQAKSRGDIGGEALAVGRDICRRVAFIKAGNDEIGMSLRFSSFGVGDTLSSVRGFGSIF